MWMYLPIAIAILSFTLYHIFQKSISPVADPYLALMATYAVALLTSLVFFLFNPGSPGFSTGLRQLNWASILLGFAIFGIEVGFLFAYRAGWSISLAGLLGNVVVALLLIPVGLLFYREHLLPANYLGILLCVGGLILLAKR